MAIQKRRFSTHTRARIDLRFEVPSKMKVRKALLFGAKQNEDTP